MTNERRCERGQSVCPHRAPCSLFLSIPIVLFFSFLPSLSGSILAAPEARDEKPKTPDLDLYQAVSQRRRARSQDLSARCEVGNSGNK